MFAKDSSRISPTAHYTGYVWCRNGLSDPALATRAGRLLFHALQPAMSAMRVLGSPALEDMLMARHRTLDWLLGRAIASGQIGQVIEIAAGLSPRGYRITRRYGDRDITYIEGELAGMCARKRARLAALGEARPLHRVVELDALLDIGPTSLATIGRTHLDPTVGTAVITEGLVNYFSPPQLTGMWARIARLLARFPRGMYISDIHTRSDIDRIPGVRAFSVALSAFTRGSVHFHFERGRAAERALIAGGFRSASCDLVAEYADSVGLSDPQARAPVRIVHATMGEDADAIAASHDDD